MKLTLILIGFILFSCTPQRRLSKLHKNHSYLFENIKDTVFVNLIDTVYTKKVKFDTLFKVKIDTIFIDKDKIKVKFLYKDSIAYLYAECENDTIYINKKTPVEIDRYKVPTPINNSSNTKWYIVLAIVLLIVTAYIISRFSK